jgi:hypothetical protein
MSDLTALAQKLAWIHSSDDVFENGARVIAQGGVPSGMVALIRAIDDTVLERNLELFTGTHIITLVAAGRRLRGVAAVVPPKGKSARFVGEPLSSEDTKTLAAVGELLAGILAPAPKLTMRSLPAGGFGKSGDRGISAARLAELWNVDMDEEPLPPLQRFLQGNSSALQTYLHVRAGEIVASAGNIAPLQTILDDQLEAFLATRAKLPGAAEGPQLLTLEGAIGANKAVALAQSDDDVVLMVYDPVALGQIHASWQAVFS